MTQTEAIAPISILVWSVWKQGTRVLGTRDILSGQQRKAMADQAATVNKIRLSDPSLPFPLADVNPRVRTVDVADLQRQALAQAQPHAVYRQKECLAARFPDQTQHSHYLIDRQDIWNSSRSRRFDNPNPRPFLVENMIPGKLKANAVNPDSAPGMGFHKTDKVVLQLFLSQVIRALVEKPGHSSYGSTVCVDGGRSFALKFQGLQMVLVKLLKP